MAATRTRRARLHAWLLGSRGLRARRGEYARAVTSSYGTILHRWLDLYLGVVKGHWKNSLKIGHVTNTYIGGMYAFTMNSHDPKGLMRL